MVKEWLSMRKVLESIHSIDDKKGMERADCAKAYD